MALHGVSFARSLDNGTWPLLAGHEGGLLATAGAKATTDTGGSMSSDSMETRYAALLALARETPQPNLPRVLGMLAEAQAEALARLSVAATERSARRRGAASRHAGGGEAARHP